MRIAVLIISLLLGLLLFVQSIIVYTSGNLSKAEDLAGGGAIGLVAALLWLLGGALVIAFPAVSAGIFTLAGLLSLLGGAAGFTDLYGWAVVAFVLAVMSWFGHRGKKATRRAELAERQRQLDRDARLEALLAERR